MRREVRWVAADGKEFGSREEVIYHEATEVFVDELAEFFAPGLKVSKAQARKMMDELEDLWDLVRADPDGFQTVIDLIRPSKRRGRPPNKKKEGLNHDGKGK